MANIINGKELKICATSAWNDQFGGIEARLYINLMVKALRKHPVDMLVFETKYNEKIEHHEMSVRLAGYDFNTNILDEKTVVFKNESLPTDTFWFKMDDYGDHYVGTFLFPSEY